MTPVWELEEVGACLQRELEVPVRRNARVGRYRGSATGGMLNLPSARRPSLMPPGACGERELVRDALEKAIIDGLARARCSRTGSVRRRAVARSSHTAFVVAAFSIEGSGEAAHTATGDGDFSGREADACMIGWGVQPKRAASGRPPDGAANGSQIGGALISALPAVWCVRGGNLSITSVDLCVCDRSWGVAALCSPSGADSSSAISTLSTPGE